MKINVVMRDVDFINDTNNYAGVDRGVYRLLKKGIIPKFTYGDYDSVSDEEREFIESQLKINAVNSEKDYTDSHLALFDLVDKGYTEIDVYGALGDRIDHELMNIQLLLNEKFKNVDIRLIDKLNVIFKVMGKKELKNIGYKYVSFIPFFNGTTLTLDGFKYDGEVEISIGSTLTVSNEFIDQTATVETNQPVIAIYSNDKGRG
ncbi:thiamine diphosphokinase [Nosocomiicoccus ampullae]|uniref:Thiamine diphosphokinase n=1 Tax=Nosocomiicoccus ampullae TaxID=489910 RepID=A0A9Q2HFF3_9STAP|nr:thiamine diphosphokinase [Nosocomiicoccus ampullae]MBB5176184.1 thiamine pyrophosphokinase [Nosocomiicoccus ampullae]QYA47351.1 thiamine diphosphokinase [Nosocomiicoccus ampullae]